MPSSPVIPIADLEHLLFETYVELCDDSGDIFNRAQPLEDQPLYYQFKGSFDGYIADGRLSELSPTGLGDLRSRGIYQRSFIRYLVLFDPDCVPPSGPDLIAPRPKGNVLDMEAFRKKRAEQKRAEQERASSTVGIAAKQATRVAPALGVSMMQRTVQVYLRLREVGNSMIETLVPPSSEYRYC